MYGQEIPSTLDVHNHSHRYMLLTFTHPLFAYLYLIFLRNKSVDCLVTERIRKAYQPQYCVYM